MASSSSPTPSGASPVPCCSAESESTGRHHGRHPRQTFLRPAGRRRRRPPATGAGSAWRGIPTTSRELSTAMTAAVTPAVSTCSASLTPPVNPRSRSCRVGRPGTRNGSAHAARRSIFLRRSSSAFRQATAVPATLVSRARSSRGISRWSANTMRESNSSP